MDFPQHIQPALQYRQQVIIRRILGDQLTPLSAITPVLAQTWSQFRRERFRGHPVSSVGMYLQRPNQ
jgi:hypothetical protein